MRCACGTEVAPSLLACPGCQRLVHAEELTGLAAAAEAALQRGDKIEALATFRRVLTLLPTDSKQASQVGARIAALAASAPLPSGSATTAALADGKPITPQGRWGARGGLAAAAAFAATKTKFLLLGLTKASTVLSMLLSVGVYWTIFGWSFALLLVLSIYVHEMGHVAALHRLGMPATPPMFIPGFGAYILLRQHPTSPRENARIGLAGPLWGLGAAVVAEVVHLAGGGAVWAAVARLAAWINLFNLLPVWQFDGGRAFAALARQQRMLVVAALLVLWVLSHEGLLILLLLTAGVQALRKDAPLENDKVALAQYIGLAGALTYLSTLTVPGVAGH